MCRFQSQISLVFHEWVYCYVMQWLHFMWTGPSGFPLHQLTYGVFWLLKIRHFLLLHQFMFWDDWVTESSSLYEKQGSPCQDPAGNRTTRRPPDHRKETQIAVVWTRLPFIRSGQNHLARHNEWGETTRQTEEVGRQHQGMDRRGVGQVPEVSGKQKKMEKLVVKSSVVAQRFSRLRDRQRWR